MPCLNISPTSVSIRQRQESDYVYLSSTCVVLIYPQGTAISRRIELGQSYNCSIYWSCIKDMHDKGKKATL